MTSPLRTKLYVPRPRHPLVARPRLAELLRHGSQSKLTLVSAPAGFGKTTLLADWATATIPDERSVAWLSLDASDNDPVSFWTAVITALTRATTSASGESLRLLESAQPPIDAVITALLNELSDVQQQIVLVLDDFHVVTNRDVQEGMSVLVENLPPQAHLLISTRADPGLRMARLRARGELVEIRAADLRFTTEEAATYLTTVSGLELSPDDIATLEGRTEGWIAALQLAVLSMRGRTDCAEFIAGFAGDDRFIVDYLIEEVLEQQSAAVREFLLKTSILDRLDAALCDAVTDGTGGKAMLKALDRGNLFLVPLDHSRRWYRYHHLFADLLRARLVDEQPEWMPQLHRRASAWHARYGEQDAAIHHALAAADFEGAADLIEPALPRMRRDRRDAALRAWLERLPTELLRIRPVLCIGLVGVLLATGEQEGVEPRLRDAERCLEGEQTGMVVVDQAAFDHLPAQVAIYRAGLSLIRGDTAATLGHARRALSILDEDDHLQRGAATALVGLASWGRGDLVTAHDSYAECVVIFHRAGNISDALGCSIALADLKLTLGRVREALRTYQQALEFKAAQAGVPRGTADMYVGLSALHLERNDLQTARDLLLRSGKLGETAALPQNRYRSRVAMARILEVDGDLSGATVLLDEAERVYMGDFSPNARPVAASRTRMWIAQGKVAEALEWTNERALSINDELSYLREFEHVTLARVLSAQREAAQAVMLLERLRRAAEDGHRNGSVIEIVILLALVEHQRGNMAAALGWLDRALSMGEPEDYVRLFVDEGPPMAVLLEAAAAHGIAPAYVRRLLASFGRSLDSAVQPGLLAPLSQRELDVLRLLATELSGPEIARQLVVSLHTVRTHTKNIYAKLAVNNRRAAVRRAHDLALMSRTGRRRPGAVPGA